VTVARLTRDDCQREMDSLVALTEEEEGFAWTPGQILHDMADKWLLSALARDENQQVVGFHIASRVRGNPHLHRIMVSSTWRSVGVGAHLMRWLCQACVERNWRPITLKVHKTNVRAVRFYERLGFDLRASGTVDPALGIPLLEGRGDPEQVLKALRGVGGTR
jgi:ribosomal protein S18 acetylase RimI-like enzyme